VQEKRQNRRVEIDLEVTCKPEGAEPYTALAVDVSIGGMFIGSPHTPPIGAAMVIEAQLPGQSKAMDFPVFVRWVNAQGFGVQFGLLGAKATHAITRAIK
jgi:c-di-GMP-binding flagellar brake protein YcgR